MLDVVLLALKAGFLIVLFLFIWLVMRGAARDVVSWGRASAPLGGVLPEPAPPLRAAPAISVAASPPPPAAVPEVQPAWPQAVPPPTPAPVSAPEAVVEVLPDVVPPAAAVGGAEVLAEAAAFDALVAAAPGPESTPEERHARREARAKERTMAGERLDFSAVINPRLIVEESPVLEVGTRYPLEGWVMIGRSPASDIVLADSFVSSTHARLVPRGQLYFVEDLGSTNGTFVDGREVAEAQLKPDTRLRIGETIFRYEE